MPHVLLVADRPFLNPVDGSSHTYLMWLRALLDLGHRVSVLSFNRFSGGWSAQDCDELRRLTQSALILDAFPDRRVAAAERAVALLWRGLAGRRYLPLPLERRLGRRRHDPVAAYLGNNQFDAILVNKLGTAALIGRDALRRSTASKLIDMHDNFPQRERLNAKLMIALTRRDPTLFRTVFQPKDLLPLATWAGLPRLLHEEAVLLAGFDHVLFNAFEEAETYVRAGVPRAKITVLPLPRPAEPAADTGPAPRPFQLGLIASESLSNIEAIAFLAREILPRLPRPTRLLVAGSISRVAARLLPDATCMGWIDDVSTFYSQIEIALVPLLTGTGVSVKTFEAASHSAAIVSTTPGTRGVALAPGRDLLVADGGAPFAAAIAQLLAAPEQRTALRRNAHAALLEHHSRQAFTSTLQALLPA